MGKEVVKLLLLAHGVLFGVFKFWRRGLSAVLHPKNFIINPSNFHWTILIFLLDYLSRDFLKKVLLDFFLAYLLNVSF